jgi:cyclopropane fatty-acyl-phospholipid synthase-like methyltransferase
MELNNYQSLEKKLLSFADIKVNGSNPWDIQVHDERFFKRAVTEVELGLGELFLLHTIGEVCSVNKTDAWTHKYIFPNGMLPSIAQLAQAMEGVFVIEDLHNFGADYDETLMAWYNNFNDNYGKLFYPKMEY